MTLEGKLNEFKAEGKQEEKVLLVKNMLQKNKYSISEIAELTQLSEEDVKKIAQELKNSTENTK